MRMATFLCVKLCLKKFDTVHFRNLLEKRLENWLLNYIQGGHYKKTYNNFCLIIPQTDKSGSWNTQNQCLAPENCFG